MNTGKSLKSTSYTIPAKAPKIKLVGYEGPVWRDGGDDPPLGGGTLPKRKRMPRRNIFEESWQEDHLGRVSLKAPHTQFSVIPSRAISDPRINTRKPLLLLLGALGMHASAKGICYPSQYRIAMLCGKSRSWVGKYMRELLAMGYIRRLVPPTPKGKRATWRIQVLWRWNEPLPGKESDWQNAPWCW